MFPQTVNNAAGSGTWVNSPHTAFARYGTEEISKIDGTPLRAMLRISAPACGLALRAARADRVVHVNNWLLSTNPWPQWDGEGIEPAIRGLIEAHPSHFVILRSLTRRDQGALLARLDSMGAILLPSRAVNVLREPARMAGERRDLARDMELLADGKFHRCRNADLTAADMPALRELYRRLYREKYSLLNPDFTDTFFEHARRTGLVDFEALKDDAGKFVAVSGCMRVGGMIYTPIAGYDLDRPQSDALYRRVGALAVERALRTGLPLHLSAGVGAFKRSRGAEPEAEYSAVFAQHLAPHRRAIMKLLAWVLETAVAPMVRKRGL
jgi:hypothetical protein